MTEMSAAEAATVARFEAGEPAPESWGGGLRDDLAVMLAWWQRIASDVSPIEAADRIFALPEIAALRAKADAADRVRELADELVSESNDGEPTGYDWGLRSAAVRLRAALDGPDQTDRGRC